MKRAHAGSRGGVSKKIKEEGRARGASDYSMSCRKQSGETCVRGIMLVVTSWCQGTFCMVRSEASLVPQYVTALISMRSGSPEGGERRRGKEGGQQQSENANTVRQPLVYQAEIHKRPSQPPLVAV